MRTHIRNMRTYIYTYIYENLDLHDWWGGGSRFGRPIIFSNTVWTNLRSLAVSLVYGVLPDTILIPPSPPIQPTNIRKVRGMKKKLRKLVTL